MSLTLLDNNEYTSQSSRYQILRVIDDEGFRYLETQNDKKVPEDSGDMYHVVSIKEEGRLDIISKEYYGSPRYWWVIALANNMIDPFAVSSGELIRIPTLLTISDYKNEILSVSYPGGYRDGYQ